MHAKTVSRNVTEDEEDENDSSASSFDEFDLLFERYWLLREEETKCREKEPRRTNSGQWCSTMGKGDAPPLGQRGDHDSVNEDSILINSAYNDVSNILKTSLPGEQCLESATHRGEEQPSSAGAELRRVGARKSAELDCMHESASAHDRISTSENGQEEQCVRALAVEDLLDEKELYRNELGREEPLDSRAYPKNIKRLQQQLMVRDAGGEASECIYEWLESGQLESFSPLQLFQNMSYQYSEAQHMAAQKRGTMQWRIIEYFLCYGDHCDYQNRSKFSQQDVLKYYQIVVPRACICIDIGFPQACNVIHDLQLESIIPQQSARQLYEISLSEQEQLLSACLTRKIINLQNSFAFTCREFNCCEEAEAQHKEPKTQYELACTAKKLDFIGFLFFIANIRSAVNRILFESSECTEALADASSSSNLHKSGYSAEEVLLLHTGVYFDLLLSKEKCYFTDDWPSVVPSEVKQIISKDAFELKRQYMEGNLLSYTELMAKLIRTPIFKQINKEHILAFFLDNYVKVTEKLSPQINFEQFGLLIFGISERVYLQEKYRSYLKSSKMRILKTLQDVLRKE